MDPNEHNSTSLKHQLLGASSGKAGLKQIDQSKVSDIIYNASRGSKYFQREEDQDRVRSAKIEQMIIQKEELEDHDLTREFGIADDYLEQIEFTRDLSQTIVHIDCDAFFASVEELDRPELKDLPFGVGTSVLSTCNYVARKHGVRSGMATFVAKKLCPNLICLPQVFSKYTNKAAQIRAVLVEYDERFESASIDEAYLNLTEYCKQDPQKRPVGEIVQEMRDRVADASGITASAGIAVNARLAKIASDQNKPNGQFEIPRDREGILQFMAVLPVRKVNGIGRVMERELSALDIHICADIHTNRAILAYLWGEKMSNFLLEVYLGLGRTCIRPAEEYSRKSIGTERTFSDLISPVELRKKLSQSAAELEKECVKRNVRGRTLTLKVKMHTYEVVSRQARMAAPTTKASDFYRLALPMLEKLEQEAKTKGSRLRIRLLGLRINNMDDVAKVGPMDAFLVRS